jgi:hypothetical protein
MPLNTGTQPRGSKGKQVKVRFFSGRVSTDYTPPHWSADTLDWTLSDPPKDYQIRNYEIVT